MTQMLSIDYDEHTTNLGGSREDDQWSRDSTRSTYAVTGARISTSGYRVCPISECKVGDTVYVVWADYTTGDTFGSDSAIEFLAAYKDRNRAQGLINAALTKTDHNGGWDINVRLDDGEEYNIHIPWLGYFETLGNVHVTEVTVSL